MRKVIFIFFLSLTLFPSLSFAQDGSLIEDKTEVVKAEVVEILSQTEDARLTIFTCSGFLDTARFVVVAKQEKAV